MISCGMCEKVEIKLLNYVKRKYGLSTVQGYRDVCLVFCLVRSFLPMILHLEEFLI